MYYDCDCFAIAAVVPVSSIYANKNSSCAWSTDINYILITSPIFLIHNHKIIFLKKNQEMLLCTFQSCLCLTNNKNTN